MVHILQKQQFSKAIGIIGGAGPMASAFLYSTLITLCQNQYGSSDYNEFPEVILASYPFTREDPKKIRTDLSLCLTKLERAGVDLFCIASHSFHAYLPDTSSITFINLISESLQEASRCHVSKALILAAQTTIDLKLYEQEDLQCYYPSKKDQQLVQKIIREVAGGIITQQQAETLKEMISALQHHFNGVIIACTELPLIHRRFPLLLNGLPMIDTIEVLAKKLLISSR